MMKMSQYFDACRELRDEYEWGFRRGEIRGKRKGSRGKAWIPPFTAIARKLLNSPGLRRCRRNWLRGFPPFISEQNACDFYYACKNRQGNSVFNNRRRHIRQVVIKILGIEGVAE